MVSDHLLVSRSGLEADEFFTGCEYDFKCASETIRFYPDKITRFLQWAQQAGPETIDGASVRRAAVRPTRFASSRRCAPTSSRIGRSSRASSRCATTPSSSLWQRPAPGAGKPSAC